MNRAEPLIYKLSDDNFEASVLGVDALIDDIDAQVVDDTSNPTIMTHSWLNRTMQKSLRSKNGRIGVMVVKVRGDGLRSSGLNPKSRSEFRHGIKCFRSLFMIDLPDPFSGDIEIHHDGKRIKFIKFITV